MKGKRLLILGAAFALGLSACANSATMVRKAPFKAGQNEIAYYTLDPVAGTNNGYANNCDVEIGDITWNITGNSTMTPWRLGGKSLSGVDRTVYSKTALASDISKVVLTVGSASSITVNSLKLVVASDSAFSSIIDNVSASFEANSDITFEPSNDSWAINSYYKFVFNVSVSGTSNKFLEFSKAIFYTNNSSGDPIKLSAPNPQYDAENNVVIWEPVANASSYKVSVGNELNYNAASSPFNGNFQAGEQYTVYVKAIGDGTNYADSDSKLVAFTAVAPFVGTDYVLCTSTSDLVVGASYIVTSGKEGTVKTMSTESNTNNRRETEVVVNSSTNKITTTSSTLVLTLGGSNGAWTFLTTNYLGTNGYLESTSEDKNYLLVNAHDSVVDIPNNGKFAISFSDSVASIVANAGTKTKMRYNSTSNLFALYSSGQNDVYLWKDADAGTAPVFGELDHIKILEPASKTTFYVGETFSSAGLVLKGYDNYDESVAVTEVYNSGFTTNLDGKVFSSEDVEEGKIVTVTYNGKTDFYYINVNAPIEKTVEEALEIANALESGNTTSEVYVVEGYITSIITAWNSEHSNVSYYVGDTSDAETVIEVYRSNAANGTTGEALKPGDKVSVTGHLTKYNTTPEFAAGCVTSLVEAAPLDKITVARAIEIANALENGVKSDKEYEIEGYIITVEYTWTSNNGITYLLGDTAGSSTTIKVFKSIVEGGQTVGEDLKQGDKVKVAGYLTKYNDAPEVAQSCVTSLLETSSDPSSYLSSFSSFAELSGNETFDSQGSTTSELVFANITPALENGVKYSDPFDIGDGTVKVTFAGGGNDGKYYTSGSGVRTYQNGTITISSSSATITSIGFTWSGNYKPSSNDVANTGSYDASTNVWTGETNSVVLTKTDSDNWRLQGLEVTYEARTFVSVDSANIKFGASISKTNWDAIAAKFTISDYGIMLFKTNNPSNYSMTSVKDFYNNNESLSVIRKGSGDAPTLEGEDYVFFAKVNVKNVANYGVTFCAAPFIVIDDAYYFLEEKHYSVNTLAQYHLSNGGSELSTAALNVLAGN